MMTKQAELKQKAYQSGLKSRALSILIYLIDRSNKDLTCFPAIPTMAEQLHISISTVKRALHELVDAGFVKKDARFRDKNRGQTSNLYTLVQPENVPTPAKPDTAPAASTPESVEVPGTVPHITFTSIAASAENSEPEPVEVDKKPARAGAAKEGEIHLDAWKRGRGEGRKKANSILLSRTMNSKKAEPKRL